MRVYGILLALFNLAALLGGREIVHSEFISGAGDLAGWEQLRFGDGSGAIRIIDAELDGAYRQPVLLNSGSARSWTFLRRSFAPELLEGAASIRATAWIRTPQPGRVRLVLTEGYSWGESAPAAFAESRGGDPGRRHVISVTLPRRFPAEKAGVALGIDYESPDSWVIVDAIRFEALRPGEAALPVPEVTSDYTGLSFPADLAGGVDADPAVYAEWLRREDEAWVRAGLAEAPEVAARTRDFTELIRLLNLPDAERGSHFLELQELRSAIEQGSIFQQFRDDTFAYAEPFLTPPGNSDGLRIVLPGNAAVDPLLLVGNLTLATQRFRLSVEGEAAALFDPHLLVAADGVPDYPERLRPDAVFDLMPQSVRGVTLNCSSARVRPGVYHGTLRLTPLAGRYAVRETPVAVEVLDHALPERAPLAIFNSEYSQSAEPQKRDLLLDARVNVFNVALRSTADFTPLRQVAASLAERLRPGQYTLLIEVWFVREANGWRPEHNAWIDALVAETRSLGLGYGDWILHIYDEVLDPQFLASARAVKAHNPAVRIFSDYIPPDAATVREFSDCVDFWCPGAGTFGLERFAAPLAAMRDSGHPVWCYNAGAAPEQPPGVARALPWTAWHYRLQGIYMWSALTASLRTTPDHHNYGLFYADGSGDWLPSRRWRQWRAGIEDYLLLDAVAATGEQGRRLAETAAREVVNGAPIAEWRRQLVEALR